MAKREVRRVVAEENGFCIEDRDGRYFFGVPPGTRKVGLTIDQVRTVLKLTIAAVEDHDRQGRLPEGT